MDFVLSSHNPKIYMSYFGHKLHSDQNEKLETFGVFHVCARDGFSGMIIGCPIIPCETTLWFMKHFISK